MGTANTNNVIEINGKRYDAVSGALLGERSSEPSMPMHHGATQKKSVDGFRRVSRADQSLAGPLKPIPAKATHKPVLASATKQRQPHQPGAHAQPHAQQPATTLMRTAVKKPIIQSVAVIKAQSRTDILAKTPEHILQPKLSHTKVDSKRLRRAERIIQSPAVSRYSEMTTPDPSPALAIPRPAPVTRQTTQQVGNSGKPPVRSTLRSPRPVSMDMRRSSVRPKAISTHTSRALPTDIFEQAMADANSHKETYSPKKRSRIGAMLSAIFAVLILAGFLGYQNLPYFNLKVAASRAGIQAKLPGYNPTGFSFGNLAYTTGNVTVNYFSDQDPNRSFNVSQKASEWNSKTLLDNFVASASTSYQTVERAGRTIYLYGNNTATWVDNGIWYTVDGRQNLSHTQLLDVALSI